MYFKKEKKKGIYPNSIYAIEYIYRRSSETHRKRLSMSEVTYRNGNLDVIFYL